MAFNIPYLPIINISALVLSLTLIILSILTIYWTDHAIHNFDFSQHSVLWNMKQWRSPDAKEHFVNMFYDGVNENMVFASTALTMCAGIAGIAAYFVTMKTKPSIITKWLLHFFPALAFVFSLIAIIVIAVHNAWIEKTTCRWTDGYIPDYNFLCTRELGVCEIYSFTLSQEQENPWPTCRELQGVRTMLIPLTVVSAVLLAMGVARMIVMRRAKNGEAMSADERVERLEREEE